MSVFKWAIVETSNFGRGTRVKQYFRTHKEAKSCLADMADRRNATTTSRNTAFDDGDYSVFITDAVDAERRFE